jgi:hypothetical protein
MSSYQEIPVHLVSTINQRLSCFSLGPCPGTDGLADARLELTLCAASAGLYDTTYRGPEEAFTMTAC